MAQLLIITDIAPPQVNGVSTTYTNLNKACEVFDELEIDYLSPASFKTVPLWFYPEIEGIINPFPVLSVLRRKKFDAVHIATEGPIGLVARLFFSLKKIPFTTAYHTRIPECINHYLPKVPTKMVYKAIAWFHNKSSKVFVVAPSGIDELRKCGVTNSIHVWNMGINTEQFKFSDKPQNYALERPIFIYVGRISLEKDIHEFLALDLPGSKLVVGDGPTRSELQQQFPDADFVGYKFGDELARIVASSDVFVFPGKTETLGLTVMESIACGTPVAAYNVDGPKDVITHGISGMLGDDLQSSALACLELDRYKVHQCSKEWGLDALALDFLEHVVWLQNKPAFLEARHSCQVAKA